jgi:hypothetical protein
MVDLMGIAADDLQCSQVSELRMADRGLSWRFASGLSPFPCRRPQDDQADAWREQPVPASFREGVLIPANNAAARIMSEGEKPLGPDPQDVNQMPDVHRGRPAPADPPRRLPDTGHGTRCVIGDLRHQLDGILTSYSPVEAALRAHGAVGLPPHGGTLSGSIVQG